MTKVYKAIDSLDNKESIFTVFNDGAVNVSTAMWAAEDEIEYLKIKGRNILLSHASRAEDMINPVLLAEW